MQNYKSFLTYDGTLHVFETLNAVTWKPGEPLLWDHVYNIEVLEQEFALIKQIDPHNLTEDAWDRVQQVSAFAIDIYDHRQRAANLIRECDRLEFYWCHLWEIQAGMVLPGTPWDEAEWAAEFQERQRDLTEMQAAYFKHHKN
jgi:hypothetical protein